MRDADAPAERSRGVRGNEYGTSMILFRVIRPSRRKVLALVAMSLVAGLVRKRSATSPVPVSGGGW